MKKSNENNLIGLLYEVCFPQLHFEVYSGRSTRTKSGFLWNFFGIDIDESNPSLTDVMNRGYFNKKLYQEFNEVLSDRENFIDQIRDIIPKTAVPAEINKQMSEILANTPEYYTYNQQSPYKDKKEIYDQQYVSRLVRHFSNSETSVEENIYLFVYFAVNKKLTKQLFFPSDYKVQLTVFANEVTSKYGTTSNPGIRATISLASKDNVIALYELADMYYYGTTSGVEKSLKKAFDIYKSLSDSEKISEISGNSLFNPLALWSLSYIFLNYRRSKDLIDCEEIDEIERLSRLDRVKKAARYAKEAYTRSENPAAANILGHIASMEESDVPGINAFKDEFNMEDAVSYYKFSAEHNYIYAYENLAEITLKRMFSDKKNKNKFLNEYLEYLRPAADNFEPWAANRLGLFYLKGEIKNKNNGDILSFGDDYIDRDEAYRFFKLATSTFIDVNSGWAYANMIIYYPQQYKLNKNLESHICALVGTCNAEAIEFVKSELSHVYVPEYLSEAECKRILLNLDVDIDPLPVRS